MRLLEGEVGCRSPGSLDQRAGAYIVPKKASFWGDLSFFIRAKRGEWLLTGASFPPSFAQPQRVKRGHRILSAKADLQRQSDWPEERNKRRAHGEHD
jgi:hypothetical protein